MARTNVGVNSPQAVKRWSTALAVDYMRELYWRKFMGKGMNHVIDEKTDLEQGMGDEVKFDINIRLKERPTYGDAVLDGSEEKIDYYQDEVKIDQVRKAVSAGGRMARQRTLHNLRGNAKTLLATYFAEWTDELIFAYASGTNGANIINDNQLFTDDSFAGNSITAPDSSHMFFAGQAKSKATLTATDIMDVTLIENIKTAVTMFNVKDVNTMRMKPIKVGSGKHHVMVMSPYQARDMRRSNNTGDWLEIQKHAGMRGDKNLIFQDSLGMLAGVVLHENESVRLFNDYGIGANINAARALYMGTQALTCAYGSNASGEDMTDVMGIDVSGMDITSVKSNSRMHWVEGTKDLGNQRVIAGGTIMGITKTQYNDRDYGIVTVDSAYNDVSN